LHIVPLFVDHRPCNLPTKFIPKHFGAVTVPSTFCHVLATFLTKHPIHIKVMVQCKLHLLKNVLANNSCQDWLKQALHQKTFKDESRLPRCKMVMKCLEAKFKTTKYKLSTVHLRLKRSRVMVLMPMREASL
jgi:stress-induced morphogen